MWKQKLYQRGLQCLVLLCCLMFAGDSLWAAMPGPIKGYYRYPAVHGKQVVFHADGDLWSASLDGGVAQRLTSHAGPEAMPHFSPDGKWIAFSAYYNGDMDVYVMSAKGGMPKRLTFRPGPEYVVGWTPDSKHVVFRSLRDISKRGWKLYTVNLEAKGLPKLVPVGFGSALAFGPKGKRVAFTRFAREQRTWKRYLGGWAQDIWVGSLKTRQYKKITKFPGTDAFPMWYNNRIYFLSDRSGERNIFSINPKGKNLLQHTFYKGWDARWPTLGGDHIVYQRGADIWCLNLKTNKSRLVPIVLPTDAIRRQTRFTNVKRYTNWFALSPKGKRLAINARGRVFNVPVKKGMTFQVTRSSAFKVKFPSFSPDGKTIVGISDRSGEDEVVFYDALGERPPKPLTKGGKAYRFQPVVSPNQKWVAFADKNMTLWVVSVKSGKMHKVTKSAFWEIRDYTWSPDGRYLAYVKPEHNEFMSIWIYDTKAKKNIRATSSWTKDFSPAWSADGKRLFFLSRRHINPFFGDFDFSSTVNKSVRIFALELTTKQHQLFAPKDSLLISRNKEENGKKKKGKKGKKSKKSKKSKKADKKGKKAKKSSQKGKKGKKGKKKKEKVKVRIDEKGLMQRVTRLPGVQPDHYFGLSAVKGRLFVMRHPTFRMIGRRRRRAAFTLLGYSLKGKKLKPITRGLTSYSLSGNGKFLAYYSRGQIRVISTRASRAPKGRKGMVKLQGMKVQIDPAQEWKQIFLDNWRLQRDFYWAPNMANIDWKGLLKRYQTLLSRILRRGELNDLIGEIIGELGTSHTYVWGGDRKRFSYAAHGVLGADLKPGKKKRWQFAKIYRGAFWAQNAVSPLAAHHLRVSEGTYLLAIDGQSLDTDDNPYSLLQNKANQYVYLTVNKKPTMKGARRILIKAINWYSARQLRYVDHVEGRRRLTLKLSKGKVGYIHVPNMSTAGLIAFYRMWYPQLHKRAMVIDIRSNGGGFVSQLLIQKLMRKFWAFFKARNTRVSEPLPSKTFHGHLAAICDAKAGSDGDIFCKSFQLNKLGPVFGTRTWGGVVGIRADKRFVDGGMTTQPEFAWWSHMKKIGWSVENHGVDPDIFVDNTPNDVVRGKDPQLVQTVRYLLNKLKQDPKKLPKPPKYPDKSIDAFRKRMKKWIGKPAPGTKAASQSTKAAVPGRGFGAGGPGGKGSKTPPRGKVVPGGMGGTKVTTGTLSKVEIARVIRSFWYQIRYCYEVQLRKNPKLSGKIVVRWTIATSGKVSSARVASTTMNNKRVEGCLVRRVMRWTFPKPKGGPVFISYPFIFKVAND